MLDAVCCVDRMVIREFVWYLYKAGCFIAVIRQSIIKNFCLIPKLRRRIEGFEDGVSPARNGVHASTPVAAFSTSDAY